MEQKRVKVFISYSWDGIEHQDWVRKLASDLIDPFGIDVILDQFELTPGKDLPFFMEKSIEQADKVIIILTPNYKTKAENRESGVGYEGSMITQELFESPVTNIKFIPVLRDGTANTSAPKFLKSKVYHSMIDDSHYNSRLKELAMILYDRSLVEKPQLAPIPDFDSIELDPLLRTLTSVLSKERLNKDLDNILSTEGPKLITEELEKLFKTLIEKAELYTKSTELNFIREYNKRDYCIISCYGYTVSLQWVVPDYYSFKSSFLKIKYFKGALRMDATFYFENEKPQLLSEETYRFNLDKNANPIWKANEKQYMALELTNKAFSFLIEKIQEEKEKNFRD